jgi:hypothetical protein
LPKKGTPYPFVKRLKKLKNHEKCPKSEKITKNAKSRKKVPKIGLSGSFEQFIIVFLP